MDLYIWSFKYSLIFLSVKVNSYIVILQFQQYIII